MQKGFKNKYKVISVSKYPPAKIRKLKNIKYINIDATKIKNFKKINQDSEFIINAAGYGSHLRGRKGKNLYKDHISIIKNIINYFDKDKIKKLIQIGSSSEYAKNDLRINENFKTKPILIMAKQNCLLIITKSI